MTGSPWEDVPAIPDLGLHSASISHNEPTESWWCRKARVQREQIVRLTLALNATKQRDLAALYVKAKAEADWYREGWESMNRRRKTTYVKGYEAGYMDALKRHDLDRP